MEGDSLPFQQAQTENGWGMSVVERIFERIQAFDTATVGTTQLIHKAHLRTYSIENCARYWLPVVTWKGADAHLDMIREFQTIEGMTSWTVRTSSRRTAIRSLVWLMSFCALLSRFPALRVSLVRLFGQSPAGFNTGDGDLENYYSRVNSLQERRLRRHIRWLLDISWRSLFGQKTA
jgi:phage-related protein (TIGR01555 family)